MNQEQRILNEEEEAVLKAIDSYYYRGNCKTGEPTEWNNVAEEKMVLYCAKILLNYVDPKTEIKLDLSATLGTDPMVNVILNSFASKPISNQIRKSLKERPDFQGILSAITQAVSPPNYKVQYRRACEKLTWYNQVFKQITTYAQNETKAVHVQLTRILEKKFFLGHIVQAAVSSIIQLKKSVEAGPLDVGTMLSNR